MSIDSEDLDAARFLESQYKALLGTIGPTTQLLSKVAEKLKFPVQFIVGFTFKKEPGMKLPLQDAIFDEFNEDLQAALLACIHNRSLEFWEADRLKLAKKRPDFRIVAILDMNPDEVFQFEKLLPQTAPPLQLTEGSPVRSNKQSEEVMTNDRRFLRSLRIAADEPLSTD